MARSDYSNVNLSRIVLVDGHDGEYYVVRHSTKNTRVVSLSDKSVSFLVSTQSVRPKPEAPVAEAPVAEAPVAEAPVAEAPVAE